MREFLQIDPRELYLPPGRDEGADPAKLTRQMSKFGRSLDGMPPPEVTRCRGGKLRLNDGVTRATRAAKLRAGEFITVEVIDNKPQVDVAQLPQVKDRLS